MERQTESWICCGAALSCCFLWLWLFLASFSCEGLPDIRTLLLWPLFVGLLLIASGLAFIAAITGSVSGLMCAFLPIRMTNWQKNAILVILIHLWFILCCLIGVPLPAGPFG
jgi:hypothetical protein